MHIHTCKGDVHAYIHTFIHAYIQLANICIDDTASIMLIDCESIYTHTHTHTYICIYIHAKETYMHTYTHTYMHTYSWPTSA